MIIVAGGDSFVYGSELLDCNDCHGIGLVRGSFMYRSGFSKSTFTSLQSDGFEYECVAHPGYGNDSISRSIINFVENNKDTNIFVIVSWTFPGRYEFRFSYDTEQTTKNWYTITPWTVADLNDIKSEFINQDDVNSIHHTRSVERAKRTGVAEFSETFYKHVGGSEYWEIYSSLKEIVYLQNYLKINNIPYMFTCADNSILYNHTVSHRDSIIQSLYNQIINDKDNWYWFSPGINPQDTQNPRGFYQWAVENKYRMGATHPLEEAHQDAATLMQEKFNELVKKSIQQNQT
jgi:hypothetical protein